MKIVLVSTWPNEGSRNVGDWLITDSMKKAILRVKPEADLVQIWREASSEDFANALDNAEMVFFTYLAIRRDLRQVYPSIDVLLESGLPLVVIGAGANVYPLHRGQLVELVTPETRALLEKISQSAKIFTTRGRLTQVFCEALGLQNIEYSGDIAFNQPEKIKPFRTTSDVRRIAISSPHNPEKYAYSFDNLRSALAEMFPGATTSLLLHGKDAFFERAAIDPTVEQIELYKEPEQGLDLYDEFDLHVGYRVHGHVSALVRGRPSFLLEQDGRGADYGASFPIAMSRPAYLTPLPPRRAIVETLRSYAQGRGKILDYPQDGISQILALIASHRQDDFQTFGTIDSSLAEIRTQTEKAVLRALS